MTEIVVSIISFLSVAASAYFAYRSKKATNRNELSKTVMEAEAKFRDDLLREIAGLKSRILELEKSNTKLSQELLAAELKIKVLEAHLSESFNKLEIMEMFCEHIPFPAWIDGDKIYCVNDAYSVEWGFTNAYCTGKDIEEVWGEEGASFKEMNQQVLKYKKSTSLVRDVGDRRWHIIKFPIIIPGEFVGVGGFAYPL